MGTPGKDTLKPMFEEAVRRDRVIKKLVAEMPYCLGEWVQPADRQAVDTYGDEILIEGVCDTYGKMGRKEKWPEHDNPMIISAYSKKNDLHFHCTVNFLIPKGK
jgi:hypothetical protein